MTKKHFIALADTIRRESGQNAAFSKVQIETLASFCASQNSNFNRFRWIAYIEGECGPNGGAVKNKLTYNLKRKETSNMTTLYCSKTER